MRVLVTGGLGYVGSHTIVSLIEHGHEVVAVDNLSNTTPDVINRIRSITGAKIPFYDIDCSDKPKLRQIFDTHNFDCVMHFAGMKSVRDSVRLPVTYYDNNLTGLLTLLKVMIRAEVKTLVFSSTATVYDEANENPLKEDSHLKPVNPYGWSKKMSEQILTDLAKADPEWNIVSLRYFNPIGAHPSGLLGEEPRGVPTNLMPYMCRVATGQLAKLHVYGDDYNTVDGTPVRDFIHILDVAEGHVVALEEHLKKKGFEVYNLGTGRGTSVMQLVRMFEKTNDLVLPYVIDPRRPGDVAEAYADCSKAEKELGWTAKHSLEDACRDAWNFQKKLDER